MWELARPPYWLLVSVRHSRLRGPSAAASAREARRGCRGRSILTARQVSTLAQQRVGLRTMLVCREPGKFRFHGRRHNHWDESPVGGRAESIPTVALLSPFRLSAFASWVILRPLGRFSLPRGRPTGGRPAGPQRGCRVAHEQDPTGQGALLTPGTVVRSRPTTILRPAPAASLRPVPIPRWNVPSAGVTFTRRHRGFTHVRPSPPGGWLPPQGRERLRFRRSSPRLPPPNGTRAASASTPSFAPRGYPRRTPRRRQAIAH